jgi:hypothetical protein
MPSFAFSTPIGTVTTAAAAASSVPFESVTTTRSLVEEIDATSAFRTTLGSADDMVVSASATNA